MAVCVFNTTQRGLEGQIRNEEEWKQYSSNSQKGELRGQIWQE